MYFCLLDAVIERGPAHIVALKQVSAAEEYLRDHFETFPVLPGVMMLEVMVQAGRELLRDRPAAARLVLGEVRALKYGRFVKPGQRLVVRVNLHKDLGDGRYELKGEGTVREPGEGPSAPAGEGGPAAVSGRFVLRPVAPA